MIRDYKKEDINSVLDIWLKSSIAAHDFIDKSFWESKIPDMRNIYLPASEIYVYEDEEGTKGFIALVENTIAAIFVLPHQQGRGIGKALIGKAMEIRNSLDLTVYKENIKSINFYKKLGFKTIKEQIDDNTGCKEIVMEFN